ncbi:MAG: hypothetical protein PVSMB4_08480 [Ktedonobacterales bacterium]
MTVGIDVTVRPIPATHPAVFGRWKGAARVATHMAITASRLAAYKQAEQTSDLQRGARVTFVHAGRRHAAAWVQGRWVDHVRLGRLTPAWCGEDA